MTEIADLLNAALKEKGWSRKRAAEEAGEAVDRFFLGRLLKGDPPPRTKVGAHTADRDERYARLAEALELDVQAFVDLVVRTQNERLAGKKESDPHPGVLDLRQRFPEEWAEVEKALPLRDVDGCVALLTACITHSPPGSTLDAGQRHRLSVSLQNATFQRSQPRRDFAAPPFSESNYLGAGPVRYLRDDERVSDGLEAAVEALCADPEPADPTRDRAELELRGRLAEFFSGLADLVISGSLRTL